MTSRSLLLLVLACTVLTACKSMDRSIRPASASFATCKGANCNLTVAVVDCKIDVDPEGLLIFRKDDAGTDHRTHSLHWRLQGNYTFPSNGITFVGAPSGVFDQCAKQNDKHFFCRNVHTTGSYKYDVRVEGRCSDGQPVPPKDPYIMND